MKKLSTILIAFMCITLKAQPSDPYILSMMGGQHLPGLEVGIIKDGRWAWYKNWGHSNIPANTHVNRNELFMMASVSKIVTATALMHLYDQHRFKLDDNISHYLPFAVKNPNFPNDSITFRMLMAHTSSIKDNDTISCLGYNLGDSPVSLDSLMRNYFTPGKCFYSVPKNFYNYAPNHKYNYSNMGAALIGYLVQKISGMPFDQYCKVHIFDSLCMQNTHWFLSQILDTTIIARPYSWNGTTYTDNGLYGYAFYPCGQLRTDINDMAKFLSMYLHHGIYNGVRVLDSATVDTMIKPQCQSAIGTAGQGLILYQTNMANGDTLYGHDGGDFGVSTSFQFNFRKHTGLLMFTNGDGFNAGVDTLLDTLYNYALTIPVSASDSLPTCNAITGIKSLAEQSHFIDIYPNPNNGSFIIEPNSATKQTMQVYDVNGKMVLSQTINGKTNIDASSLNEGIYNISLQSNEGVVNKRLVIVR